MRTTRPVLAIATALVALAATGAHATRDITTSTPCTQNNSTAWAYFMAGATTTWQMKQHARNGSTEADSDLAPAAVKSGETYKVYVTDPNWTTLSLTVSDPTDTVTAVGSGDCDGPSASPPPAPGGGSYDRSPIVHDVVTTVGPIRIGIALIEVDDVVQ